LWNDHLMLRSIEISAVLSVRALHIVHWRQDIELSLDCFVCERVGRTTILKWGAERALCTSDEEHGRHYTAAQVAAFDTTVEREQLRMRAVVDYWWAPFHDAKRAVRGLPLSDPAWVRLNFGYFCQDMVASATAQTQTNLVRPSDTRCKHCKKPVAASTDAPTVRLLT